MGVEEVVCRVSFPGFLQSDDLDQHVGECVSGHCAVRSPFHLEVEKEPAIAAQDRDRPHRAFGLEAAQGGDLFQSRPVLVLEHDAGWVVRDDSADDAGRHHDAQGERVILDDHRNVGSDSFDRLGVISDDLIVRAERRRRRDHDTGRTRIHARAGEGPHGGKARRRDADDDGQPCPTDDAGCNRKRFLACELRRLAHDAENGDAGCSHLAIEVGHAVDRRFVDPSVREKGCRGDGIDACGGSIEHGRTFGWGEPLHVELREIHASIKRNL